MLSAHQADKDMSYDIPSHFVEHLYCRRIWTVIRGNASKAAGQINNIDLETSKSHEIPEAHSLMTPKR